MFLKANGVLTQVNKAQEATIFVAILVAIALAGLACYALSPRDPSAQAAGSAAKGAKLQLPSPPSLMAAGGSDADALAPAASSTGGKTAGNTAEATSPSNSLANTQLDGDWSIGPNGQPQPSLALRRRLDYFLLLQGEVAISTLTAQIRQQVQAAHGAAAAQQIIAVWDNYLRLQKHNWATQANPQRRDTWGPALAERTAVRRELLGIAWAEAFYADEENALRQMIAQANSGLPVTAAKQASDPIALPDAAERIAVHETQWQAWEQRLATARSHIAQLRSAPELSAPQRSAAITAYIHQQFSGGELLRAKALLNL
jgi:lipase chaperone LimK